MAENDLQANQDTVSGQRVIAVRVDYRKSYVKIYEVADEPELVAAINTDCDQLTVGKLDSGTNKMIEPILWRAAVVTDIVQISEAPLQYRVVFELTRDGPGMVTGAAPLT